MTWQEHYEIARSLRQRADRLFGENEHQYASEGIWGALHYTARAMAECFGRSPRNLAGNPVLIRASRSAMPTSGWPRPTAGS